MSNRRRGILKVSLGLLIGVVIAIRVITLAQGSKKTYNQVPAKETIIAMSYHYIREETLWNKILEFVTQDKELTTYTVYTEDFETQIDTLIEQGAYFATLEEIEEFQITGNFPEKCVWICFDDGDISVYEKAYPILKERSIPFTMYIIVGQVGNNNFNNLKLCNWDQLREMQESGLVSFGSHTYNMHYLEDDEAVFLDESNYEIFYEDIKKSKEVLEHELGVEVTSIAYPFGNTSDDVTEITKRAGFTNAFILAPHPITKASDAYYQNRYLISTECFYQIGLGQLDKNGTVAQLIK